MADDKADAEKVKADHAKTGRPVSATEDPTNHSIGGKDKVEAAPEDNTIAGKIRRSELFLVNDHVNGGGPYVGISPQNDPNASDASKRLSAVTPLSSAAPRTGMIVKPKDGDAFAVGDGFGPDATPADWAKVTKPDGSPLFA